MIRDLVVGRRQSSGGAWKRGVIYRSPNLTPIQASTEAARCLQSGSRRRLNDECPSAKSRVVASSTSNGHYAAPQRTLCVLNAELVFDSLGGRLDRFGPSGVSPAGSVSPNPICEHVPIKFMFGQVNQLQFGRSYPATD
jgi:hypothetical protein